MAQKHNEDLTLNFYGHIGNGTGQRIQCIKYYNGSNSALDFMTTTAVMLKCIIYINIHICRIEFGLICGSGWKPVVLRDSFSFFKHLVISSVPNKSGFLGALAAL